MHKMHWTTVASIVMSILSFVLGSIAGGVIFLGLAVWVELNGALKMARKVKAHVNTRREEAQGNE